MRLTPQQSQLEVESSSPESLAPATPIRKDSVTERGTCKVLTPDDFHRRSALDFGREMLANLDDTLSGFPIIVDPAYASILPKTPSPSRSPPVSIALDALKRDTSTAQAEPQDGERTLDDELLDSVDEADMVCSADIELPPRHTLEPDVSIAMAMLNSEPLPQPEQVNNGSNDGLNDPTWAIECTAKDDATPASDAKRQSNHVDQDEEVVDVLVFGEREAADPHKAPSLTQLDTRLRSGLTRFVLLAPDKPGPVRGALVTRSKASSPVPNASCDTKPQARESAGMCNVSGSENTRADVEISLINEDKIAITQLALATENHGSENDAAVENVVSVHEDDVLAHGSCTMSVSPPLLADGGTDGPDDANSSAACTTPDFTLASSELEPQEQTKPDSSGPACAASCFASSASQADHFSTHEMDLALPGTPHSADDTRPVAPKAVAGCASSMITGSTSVNAACQADFTPWPCAQLGCTQPSERCLTSQQQLNQQRSIASEDVNVWHVATGLDPAGSRSCWRCRLNNKVSRKKHLSFAERAVLLRQAEALWVLQERRRVEQHAQRLERKRVKKAAAKKRKRSEAECEPEVLRPSGKRAAYEDAETVCGADQVIMLQPGQKSIVDHAVPVPLAAELLLTIPVSMESFSDHNTPLQCTTGALQHIREHCSSIANPERRADRPGPLENGRAPSTPRKSSVRTSAPGDSSPKVSSPSRYASHTPSPLRSVQSADETPPTSPPPIECSPSAGRGRHRTSGSEAPEQQSLPISPAAAEQTSPSPAQSRTYPSPELEDSLVTSIVAAFKHYRDGEDDKIPVHLHFCACGRDLVRFAERLPCKTCMNEQYWDMLESFELRGVVTGRSDADMVACESSHSADLCYVCRKLVAFDDHGLCIPCANPMVFGSRRAGNRQGRNFHTQHRRMQVSQVEVSADVVATMKKVKREPLKGILKRR
ncbi:hypothetical protein Slin15195_G111090 [Septoria linicola]|uniref:Uncharacterized protein n=1 Tax=Septoria linicola TaxID=215465 RepID=A0A9Q9B3Z5_9PEZI|nr:hypothetical protein Slin15195_G111090 [Septoria linicola]